MPAPVYADTARLLPAALDRAAELVHRHPRRAERLALWVERRAVLHGQQARARYVRAQVLTERGELDEALRLIADARALWTEDGDVLAALRTDLGRMHVLDDLGRHQEAIEVGERLVAALDGLCAAGAGRAGDDARYLRAHAVKNLGVAYARAAVEYAALGRHAETALPLANTGLELVALGRPGEALAAFERAIEIFEEIDDPVFAAQCRGDAAQAHRQLGQVGEALRLLEGARDSLERLGATTEAVRLRLALAQSHLGIGLWAEARDAASAAVDEAAHHGLRHDEARARFLVSLCDLAQDRCDAALEQLATAEALFLEVDDQQHLARVALACAEALARLGRREEARHTAAGCVTALERGGWVVPLVTARMLQFDLAEDRGEAQARLAEVAGLVDGLDLPELSYEHRLRTARVLRARGELDLAVHHLDRALAELERATGALPDYALLTSFRTHRSQAHGELVEVLLERGRPGDVEVASRVADDVRARTLADLLARAAGRGPVLSAAGRDLGEAFAELSEQYLAEERPAVGRPDTSRARTRELERRVNSLRTRHLDDDPATRAQRVRPDDQTILVPTIAYHVSSDDLIVFIHRRDGVVVRRLLGAVPRLHRFLDDLDDQWARAAIAATHGALGAARLVASSRATLRDLHELLVAPFSDTLADVGPRLCVVLDGRMGSVPFSLLHDGDGHLLERWTITLAPRMLPASASPLVVRPRARVAGVGVADTDAPAATAEADTVAASHRQAVLLEGPAATVQAVRESVAGAELVHVACHGLHQPDNPLFSRLRLHDRWMTSAEIVQLEISGALVVLSACQSGTHGRHREPVGLAWAFLAAGATGAVVAQWHVADATTAPVMASLHAGLAAGLPADEALRAAQREAAASGLHPFFWGAFALVSSPAPRAHGVVREAV